MNGLIKLLGVFGVIFLVSCVSQPAQPAKSSVQALADRNPPLTEFKTLNLSSVTHIEAHGPMVLKITAGTNVTNLTVMGKNTVAQSTDARIDGNTLYLNASSNDNPDEISVNVRNLKALFLDNTATVYLDTLSLTETDLVAENTDNINLRGDFIIPELSLKNVKHFYTNGSLDIGDVQVVDSDQIYLKGLHSQSMAIHQKGSGMLVLRGHMNITSIDQDGSGHINLYWLNSNKLEVSLSDRSSLSLAGDVKKLVANVTDTANLDAEHLKAQEVDVKTQDSAEATVHPLSRLFATALNTSYVRYYGKPKYLEHKANRAKQIQKLALNKMKPFQYSTHI